jgi:S-formylglutathione hydrolase FrmB
MNKLVLLAFTSALSLLAACARAAPPVQLESAASSAQIVRTLIPGPSLNGDLARDETPLEALVYLPPSYAVDPDRRYPLVVLLHGYWSSPDQWEDKDFSLTATFGQALAAGEVKEMIVVMPAGIDALGGGFYVNGAASGDWEDYIAEDVVTFAEAHYRTLATRDSRGIAGHSMGGYGALSIAASRPDVFSAAYAMSPCCGDLVGDFAIDSPAWKTVDAIRTPDDFEASSDFFGRVLIALGAAWAPNADAPLHSGRPVDRGVIDTENLAHWQARTLTARIAEDAEGLRRLTAIGIDVGDKEQFSHIRLSVPVLSRQLSTLGIAHDFETYPGDHVSGIGAQMREEVLPFFSEHLSAD